MAKIRNIGYNGIKVEQPIFNGTKLTKWIHNGIVVWENGGWMQNGYLIGGHVDKWSSVSYNSTCPISINVSETDATIYSIPEHNSNSYYGMFTFTEYPDVVFCTNMPGNWNSSGTHFNSHRYCISPSINTYNTFHIVDLHSENILFDANSIITNPTASLYAIFICANNVIYIQTINIRTDRFYKTYKLQFTQNFNTYNVTTYDGFFNIDMSNIYSHNTMYPYIYRNQYLNINQFDKYIMVNGYVVDLDTNVITNTNFKNWYTSDVFTQFIKTPSGSYKAIIAYVWKDLNNNIKSSVGVVDIAGNVNPFGTDINIKYCVYVNNIIYIYYMHNNNVKNLYLIIMDSDFNIIQNELIFTDTNDGSNYFMQTVEISNYDGTESKEFRYYHLLPDMVGRGTNLDNLSNVFGSLSLGKITNNKATTPSTKVNYLIIDGYNDTAFASRAYDVTYIYSLDDKGILPTFENISNYRYVTLPDMYY